jgi:hypothetical protein
VTATNWQTPCRKTCTFFSFSFFFFAAWGIRSNLAISGIQAAEIYEIKANLFNFKHKLNVFQQSTAHTVIALSTSIQQPSKSPPFYRNRTVGRNNTKKSQLWFKIIRQISWKVTFRLSGSLWSKTGFKLNTSTQPLLESSWQDIKNSTQHGSLHRQFWSTRNSTEWPIQTLWLPSLLMAHNDFHEEHSW